MQKASVGDKNKIPSKGDFEYEFTNRLPECGVQGDN